MKYVEILNPSKSSCHGAVNSKAQTADRPKKSFSAARLGRKSDVAGQSELVAWRSRNHPHFFVAIIDQRFPFFFSYQHGRGSIKLK